MTAAYYWNGKTNMFCTLKELIASAKSKIAFLNEDKFEGYVYGLGYEPITEGMAREFYRDLCGVVNGNSGKTNQGIMSSELIATKMGITIAKANAFLYACREYGITERQSGLWVV